MVECCVRGGSQAQPVRGPSSLNDRHEASRDQAVSPQPHIASSIQACAIRGSTSTILFTSRRTDARESPHHGDSRVRGRIVGREVAALGTRGMSDLTA